jgi:microcystin-dependent protein
MSSTYSTNLRTELIGTGDQAGNWGNTTNGTLGSILEQAIAGVSGGPYIGGTYPAVNFSTDADITLTANNGSVDQARNAVLVITSSVSLTTTRNVIAPAPASKVYVIKNSTTGGQSIQIKYATGTAVVIPNGQAYPVYGDGTNFYLATTSSVPTGAIQMWSTTTAPTGYILCNGVAISRTTYAALFGVIGTTFGAGDGSTTFNVPQYGDRMPVGAGGSYGIGAIGGSATTTLVTANLPGHTHNYSNSVSGTVGAGQANIQDPGHAHAPSGSQFVQTGSPVEIAGIASGGAFSESGVGRSSGTSASATGIYDAGHAHTFSASFAGTTDTGTGIDSSFSTISPYLGINFIIKT